MSPERPVAERPPRPASVDAGVAAPVPSGSPRALHALDYLLEHRRADLDDLTAHVAAMETGKSPAELTRFERRLVGVSLRRVHLPALDRRGLASWDPDRRTARLPGADRPGPAPRRRSPAWYLALAAGQAVVVAGAALDAGPLAAVDPLLAATAATALVFCSALAGLARGR